LNSVSLTRLVKGHLVWLYFLVMKILIFLFSLLFTTNYSFGQLYSGNDTLPPYTVFIFSSGFHTGAVIKISEVSREIWPEIDDFSHMEYADVGWGDFDYYQRPGFDPYLALKAGFWPTASVIRVAGYENPNFMFFDNDGLMKIEMDKSEFDELCRFIHQAYQHDALGAPIVTSVFPGVKFYLARRTYHFMRTCNTWLGMAFRNAGIPIHSIGIILAHQLFFRLEPYGEYVE
jgi:hypothetical protein